MRCAPQPGSFRLQIYRFSVDNNAYKSSSSVFHPFGKAVGFVVVFVIDDDVVVVVRTATLSFGGASPYRTSYHKLDDAAGYRMNGGLGIQRWS